MPSKATQGVPTWFHGLDAPRTTQRWASVGHFRWGPIPSVPNRTSRPPWTTCGSTPPSPPSSPGFCFGGRSSLLSRQPEGHVGAHGWCMAWQGIGGKAGWFKTFAEASAVRIQFRQPLWLFVRVGKMSIVTGTKQSSRKKSKIKRPKTHFLMSCVDGRWYKDAKSFFCFRLSFLYIYIFFFVCFIFFPVDSLPFLAIFIPERTALSSVLWWCAFDKKYSLDLVYSDAIRSSCHFFRMLLFVLWQ